MGRFKEFLSEDVLNEKLVSFAKKLYPKGGHIVFLAGGSGSGKSFARKNLLGIDAITIDVDAFKSLILQYRKSKLANLVNDEVDIDKLTLSNPEHVSLIHNIIAKMELKDKKLKALTNSIQSTIKNAMDKGQAVEEAKLPNIIVDGTLRSSENFIETAQSFSGIGYETKNIHVVWILTKLETALKRNASRERTVKEPIVKEIFKSTMNSIKSLVDQEAIDGDLAVIFNEIENTTLKKSDRGGSFIEDFDVEYIKRSGKNPKLTPELKNKLNDVLKSSLF